MRFLMAREDLTYIDLADFTPGIYSNYMSTTAFEPHKDGAAQEEGTYGCVALPTGGIVPLPRWVDENIGITMLTPEADIEVPTAEHNGGVEPEVYYDRAVVLDARAVSPVTFVPPFDEDVDYDLPPTDLFIVRQTWCRRKDGSGNPTGSPEQFWYMSNHRYYLGDPYTRNGNANYGIEGSSLTPQDIVPNRWRYGGGSLTETRTVGASESDPTALGAPIIACALGGARVQGGVNVADTEGEDLSRIITYPDINTTILDGPTSIYPALAPFLPMTMIFGHQGRLMGFGRNSGYKTFHRLTYHGEEFGYRAASELIAYWPVNNLYNLGSPDQTLATIVEEISSGYGTACPVSADSLFLVKHAGGAVLVNGDIANPTVVRLPGIPSTGGWTNRGVMTTMGYVYGTNSGVWAWTGSDSAEALSQNLRDTFWVPEDPTTELHELETSIGSFAYNDPWIFAPNNWMMDTRTGGWWRYYQTPAHETAGIATDGITFAYNEVDAAGFLFAVVKSYTQPGTVIRVFDPSNPVNEWYWRSQPIARTQNRYLNYRQINLLATGHGTITVTLTGVDGSTTTPVVLTVDSDTVAQIIQPVALTTTDVVIDIHAEATDPEDPAPTLHRISLGYRTQQGIDHDGTIRGV
jgi:hypothetical protein